MMVQKTKIFMRSRQFGYSLLEVIVVMAISSVLIIMISGGIIKIRQIFMVTRTAEELSLYLHEARRKAINSVATSSGHATEGYYIYMQDADDEYYFGECHTGSCSASPISVKSDQYMKVEISECIEGANSDSIIKFEPVTGRFSFTDPLNVAAAGSSSGSCTITVGISTGPVRSSKSIVVSATERIIQIR